MGSYDDGAEALTGLRNRLEDGLAHLGLTKTQLAARAGLGRTTVHAAFQAGGCVPSAATVATLARALNLSEEELLELRRTSTDEAVAVHGGYEGPGKPIAEWNPHDLEVHPAGTSAPVGSDERSERALSGYVVRGHDQVLAAVVRRAAEGRSGMLVLVGSSSTGKTRACWEAIRPLAAKGWRLWHPYDPTRAEAVHTGLEQVRPHTVVWLNEAQHYLGDPQAGEPIAAALNSLLAGSDRRPVLILGTLWPDYADEYAALPHPSAPDPHSMARELLAGRTLTVPDAFDKEALRAATAHARNGDQLLADALTRTRAHGRVTQDLAGAPELLRRYEHGTPASRAVLEATMDARRLGVGLHLPQAFLTDAASDYFTDHDYDRLTEDWAEAAFADLARPVHGKQAPLHRANPRPPRRPLGTVRLAAMPVPATGPVYRLADYLEQHGRAERRRSCPPASFWHAAHSHLTHPDDLANLASAAQKRCRLQWAECLWHRAADVGHPDALGNLAEMREEAGDREHAETLYRQAADASHPYALTRLAEMREEVGDWEGAETFARQAADAGQRRTLTGLASMREEAGDREGAEALYRQAADAGQPDALGNLAWMREKAGDREGAEAFALQAADAGHPFTLGNLAWAREEAGDRESAEALALQAADAGHPVTLTRLAEMREKTGDRESAEALALQAADAGHPVTLTRLAEMREKTGDRESAEALYRHAADAGHPDARIRLAWMREEAGDREGAETLYRQAADVGQPDALGNLAWMREKAGDGESAEAFALQAADAGHPDALDNLVRAREKAGDRKGAETLARQAADAGHADALGNLAWMREKAGDRESAETLARQAADAGHRRALTFLARMREETGDGEGAEAFAWQAADAGQSNALTLLTRMREEAGDLESAEALARQAADAGHSPGHLMKRWAHGLEPDGSPTPPWS